MRFTKHIQKRSLKNNQEQISDENIDYNLLSRLILDLENAASHNELGYFWRKAKLLKNDAKSNGQGFKELLALASASQAYRKVIGKLTQSYEKTEKDQTDIVDKPTLSTANLYEKSKPFFREIWSLLAGSAVFGGFLIENPENGLWAAFGGIIAAILTSMTLNITYTRTRNRTIKKEFTFIMDTSLHTLNREIPTLISRLKEAGFFPVFIIDELDKFLDKKEHLDQFVKLNANLKHLIADRTFFCFLTDRNYFDHLTFEFKNEAYPIAYTLFSRRLFITYGPNDLHFYLWRLFVDDGKKEAFTSKIHCYIYWCLYKSRFHIGDLKKEFFRNIKKSSAQINNEFSIIIPSDIDARINAQGLERPVLSFYTIQIIFQLAIEYLLTHSGSKVKERIEQEPHFAQLIYDTLYYPSRKWESGVRELDISRDALEVYLIQRMIPIEKATNEPGATQLPESEETNVGDEFANSSNGLLNNLDFDFLYNQMTLLVSFFEDIDKLRSYLQVNPPDYIPQPMIWQEIIDLIPARSKPLLTLQEQTKYEWNYDFYGRELPAKLTEDEEEQMFDYKNYIYDFNSLLTRWTASHYELFNRELFEKRRREDQNPIDLGDRDRMKIQQFLYSKDIENQDYLLEENIIQRLQAVENYENTRVLYDPNRSGLYYSQKICPIYNRGNKFI